MANLFEYIDLSQKSLYYSLGSIVFNPLFWNIVARSEYKSKILTKIAGGNRKLACYGLAFTIFTLGLFRDFLYERALRDQPSYKLFESTEAKIFSVVLLLVGNILVLSSMYALGITGTYLGDYFGILMNKRVTGFPFNITDNPMYYGSTISFIGTSIWFAKPAGLFISFYVLVMYLIALRFEEPFTSEIYAKRDRERSLKSL